MFKIDYSQNSVSQNNAPQPLVVKDNPGFFKKMGAGMAGGAIVALPQTYIMKKMALGMQDGISALNKAVSKDEIQILNQAGEKIFNESGLAQKGVSFIRGLTEDDKSFIKACKNMYKGAGSKIKKLSTQQYQLALGRNAFFIPLQNTIKFTDKMALSQFHELGHAMNYNGKGLGNFLWRARPEAIGNYWLGKIAGIKTKFPLPAVILSLAGTVIGLTAIYKNKKAKGEKPQGTFDKVTTFIKDNVGKLTFLVALPRVLEEGLASFKGERAVKNLISKDLFKKVKLQNRIGLLGYAASAALISLGAVCASKIRDKIAQPNLNK